MDFALVQTQGDGMKLAARVVTLAAVVVVALLAAVQAAGGEREYHDYCVVGAGPSGLQMGHFLQKKGRDYIIFEKSDTPGDFFVKYPRHRMLISINKRNTGQKNKEFNLRHDWNSLLSDDESLQFRHYSKIMFPDADIMVQYLRDYQKKLGIKVQFNTEISNIRTQPDPEMPHGHVFLMNDQHGKEYSCRTLIVATGMWKPNIPNIQGMEHVKGYEDFSIKPDDYEGKTVLILGRGNAAFETADAIYGATNLIHMVARSRVRLSWATHYVGDLRAVNNGLLDTYQLKSLDGLLEASIDEVVIQKRGDKLYLVVDDHLTAGANPNASSVATTVGGRMEHIDNFALREPYDEILRCLGFVFDESIFSNDIKVSHPKGRKKKYPAIHHDYQSQDMPGLYIAGTASHSLDHRKSAGGFVHGFRYTARALHHILEKRYEGVVWPSFTAPTTQLLNTILKRINEASGIYQMFGVLGDVIALRNNNQEFEYFEEFPINLLADFENITGKAADKVIVLVMQYGANFSGPGKDIFRIDRATGEPSEAHTSNFLHPVFYYYPALPTQHDMRTIPKNEHLPRPLLMHHIVEDFLTLWNAPISHVLPLRRYLERVLNMDLRHFYAANCLKMAMTRATLPPTCQEHFAEGQGLPGTPTLIHNAVLSGLY